jgi:hypothetical protein
MYNIPAEVSDETVTEIVESVPFNPFHIANCLNNSLNIDLAWLSFFKENDIAYMPLAYEDFIGRYEYYIDFLLGKLQVPEEDRHIPKQPLKKVGNRKNEEFRTRFLEFISGKADFNDVLPGDAFVSQTPS